ncbi:hypothetical protein Fcan01_24105 [Folsomia candida]|uniref:Uncharacterized protein n=1 Tax=Folsomia candida TaxID=158441 RepID=A0A226D9G4_FOLCA|nr:hypothetical protein Fcan01_24105 [Folsomia candida]
MPNWIISAHNPDSSKTNIRLLLISPFEANELIPIIKNLKNVDVNLRMFAPRLSPQQSILINSEKLVFPSQPNNIASPFLPPLFILSDTLYFLDNEELESYCKFTGMIPNNARTKKQEKAYDMGFIDTGFLLKQFRKAVSPEIDEICGFTKHPELMVREIIESRHGYFPTTSHVSILMTDYVKILMPFGYVQVRYQYTKTPKWFYSMAPFRPATPTGMGVRQAQLAMESNHLLGLVDSPSTTTYPNGIEFWVGQILHCGLDSAAFQPSQDYNLPTTIYQILLDDTTWIEQLDKSKTFIPVSKGRTSLPTFILIYFDEYLKFTPYSHHNVCVLWLRVQNNRFLQFLGSKKDFLFNEYSFVVLVTRIAKSELTRHQNGFDYSRPHDFVIAYYQEDRTFEICVMPHGQPIQFPRMKCHYKETQCLERLVTEFATPPLLWSMGYIQGGDLIQSDLKDNQLIAPMSKVLNPFLSTQSIHQHLIHTSFHRANASLIYLLYDMKEIEYKPHLSLLVIAEYLHPDSPSVIVAIESLSYKFITCYTEKYISFELYLKPFEPSLWAMLIISIMSLTVVMEVYLCIGKRPGERSKFSPWIFILGNLFEEAGFIPKNVFRLILGSWILISVILTSCYNGLITTELNAPLRFSELICRPIPEIDSYMQDLTSNITKWLISNNLDTYADYWIETWLRLAKHLNYSGAKSQKADECFNLLSPVVRSVIPGTEVYEMHYVLLTRYKEMVREYAFVAKQWGIIFGEMKRLTAKILQLTPLLNPRHSLQPNDIGSENIIKHNIRYAIEKEGEDSILDITLGWIFDRPGNSKIPRYHKALLESGIHSRLVKEQNGRKYRQRKKTWSPIPPRVSPMAVEVAVQIATQACWLYTLLKRAVNSNDAVGRY